MTNLNLALPHFREAARIFRNVNHVDNADAALCSIAATEKMIQRIGITTAAGVVPRAQVGVVNTK